MVAAATAQIASSPHCYSSASETWALSGAKTASFPLKLGAVSFAAGAGSSPLLIKKAFNRRQCVYKSKSVPIRCEQRSRQRNGVGMWLGRVAIAGFASAITVEISTGRGLLQNFGVHTPLPTVAWTMTMLLGVLATVFIFQSESDF